MAVKIRGPYEQSGHKVGFRCDYSLFNTSQISNNFKKVSFKEIMSCTLLTTILSCYTTSS